MYLFCHGSSTLRALQPLKEQVHVYIGEFVPIPVRPVVKQQILTVHSMKWVGSIYVFNYCTNFCGNVWNIHIHVHVYIWMLLHAWRQNLRRCNAQVSSRAKARPLCLLYTVFDSLAIFLYVFLFLLLTASFSLSLAQEVPCPSVHKCIHVHWQKGYWTLPTAGFGFTC